MPPWKNQLSEDERHALVEFVRSLYGTPQENVKTMINLIVIVISAIMFALLLRLVALASFPHLD